MSLIFVRQEVVSEVIEKIEQDFVAPSPQSTKSSSLTSGSLADISSLGSRSSSTVGSMQKSTSTVSVGMQKSISLSSISEADSSLPKTISLPGSVKTSPNVSGHENSAGGSRMISPNSMDQREASLSKTRSSPGFPQREPSVGAFRKSTSPQGNVPAGRSTRSSPSSVQVGNVTPPLEQRKSTSGTKSTGNVTSATRNARVQGRMSRTDSRGSSSSSSATSPENESSRKGSEFARPHRTPSRRVKHSSPDQGGQEDSSSRDGRGNTSKRKSPSLGSGRGSKGSPVNVANVSPQRNLGELDRLVLPQSSEESDAIPCAQPPPKSNGRVSSDEPMEQSDREGVEGSTTGGEGAGIPEQLDVNLPGGDEAKQEVEPKTRPSRGRRKAKNPQKIPQLFQDTQLLPVEGELLKSEWIVKFLALIPLWLHIEEHRNKLQLSQSTHYY